MSTFRNEAVKFIYNRISSDLYRGPEGSQHNRYTKDQLITILKLLKDFIPSSGFLKIRTTDISKEPKTRPERQEYANFCDKVKQETGIGTQDAMRKNLFVDFHRMGFIERYDKDFQPIDPYSKGRVEYVGLTDLGLELVESNSIIKQYMIFSRGLDNLLGGYISILLELFTYEDYDLDGKLDYYEYMFFISAIDIGPDYPFNITLEKAVEYIQEWRSLSRLEREGYIEDIKEKMNPANFTGDKTDKRDFHNRLNKIDQIFYLLNQSVYFEHIDGALRGKIILRSTNIKGESFSLKDIKRSKLEKDKYFKEHKIGKRAGFELHHVVPLSRSKNVQEFIVFDNWKNMVYIDAFSHAKVTQKGNNYVILNRKGDEIYLSNFANSSRTLIKDENIAFDNNNWGIMKNYNNDLLKR